MHGRPGQRRRCGRFAPLAGGETLQGPRRQAVSAARLEVAAGLAAMGAPRRRHEAIEVRLSGRLVVARRPPATRSRRGGGSGATVRIRHGNK